MGDQTLSISTLMHKGELSSLSLGGGMLLALGTHRPL
jgi:hypothetical protein